MNGNYDEIKIHLPQKADYLGFLRLSVSGLASKMGFDIDTIEDIKVAVSEVCSRLISQGSDEYTDYDITFQLFNWGLRAILSVQNHDGSDIFEGESGDFAKAIISTLMDEFEISTDKNYVITMGKKLGDCMNG
ncbi:MAG: ATP-binding protein [Thermoclostridium sp.]|nr:ATP-binding protein [Thermoclostridium sp.]